MIPTYMMITLVPDLSTGNKQYECILLTNGEIFTCVIDSQLHSSILLGEAKFEIFFSSMTTAEFLSVFNFGVAGKNGDDRYELQSNFSDTTLTL
jgi:hypothetical protein